MNQKLEERIRELETELAQLKLNEKALRNEAYLRRILVEQSRDGIVVVDQSGKSLEANQKFADLLGYSIEEVNNLYVWDWDNRWSKQELLERIQSLNISGEHFETVHRRKDGTSFDVEICTNSVIHEGRKLIFCVCRDITVRKQVERDLKRIQHNLAEAQRIAHVGSWEWNLITNEVTYSEEMKRIWGIESEGEIFGLEDIMKRIVPEDIAQVEAALNDAIEKDNPYDLEFRISNSKGEMIHIHGMARVERDRTGKAVAMRGTGQDITERKRVEESLQNHVELLNEVGTIAKIGGWEMDLITRKAKWTKGTYDIVEIGYDEHIPGPDEHVDHYLPEYRPIVAEAMRKLIEDDIPLDFEAKLRTAKGNIIWCRAMGRGIRKNGKCIKVFGTFQNIDALKKAEESLKKSENRLIQAQRIGRISDWEWDFISGKFHCSEEVFRILQIQPQAASIDLLQSMVHPDDSDRFWKQVDNARKKTGSFSIDFRIIRPDASVLWIYVEAEVQHDSQGKLARMFGVIQNIDQRKRAEAEKEKLEVQLRQSQKLETIGTLAGGIAHDFNNILTIIIGNAELALDSIPQSEPTHANLEEIKSAGLRARDIAGQLLTFSRQMDLNKQPINLVAVLNEAFKFLRSIIPATIDIRLAMQAEEIIIKADQTQIHQIMMNLCSNAIHAMEKTGGTLTISLMVKSLDSQSAGAYPEISAGEYAILTVHDTGSGINPEIRDRIFDPYYTTKEVGKGSGMGLAVVHGIIKNHNGAISIDSTPEEGTTFTILFPVAGEKIAGEIEKNEEISTGNETILFVDDEQSIARMSKKMLERLGYTVKTATNPHEALKLFCENSDLFDLVITDMTMPSMTGVALYEKIRNVREDIPVIVTTGHSTLIDQEKAREMGLAAFLMKPINTREIAAVLRQVIAENRK